MCLQSYHAELELRAKRKGLSLYFNFWYRKEAACIWAI